MLALYMEYGPGDSTRTSCRQTGQVFRIFSHLSTHREWNSWLHEGRTRN